MAAAATTTEAQTLAPFDPFASQPGFQYAPGSTVRPAYPLSPKSYVPPSIVRPNYARESVSGTFWAWWEVGILAWAWQSAQTRHAAK